MGKKSYRDCYPRLGVWVVGYGRHGRVYLYGQIPHHCLDVYVFRARPACALLGFDQPFAGSLRAGHEFKVKPPFHAY